MIQRRDWWLTGICLFSVEILVLFIPPIINQGPIVFPDLLGYWRGGQAGTHKLIGLLTQRGGTNLVGTSIENAHAVRSAFYSLFTYLSATVSLWLLIAIQATIVLLLLHLVFALFCPNQRWRSAVFVMLLGLTTSLSWVATSTMPDIFTPLLALSLITLILFWREIGTIKWALHALVAASVVMHITNLPIALGIIVVAGALRWRQLWEERAHYLLIGGALGIGIIAMLAVSVLVFKEWTLSPRAPTFLLARSIEDGPGKLYLREHCPQIGLAMCEHLDKLDVDTENFIWSEDPTKGVYSVASPEGQARLRLEDKRIYVAAALEHPWMQFSAIVWNSLVQTLLFTSADYYIPSHAEIRGTSIDVYPLHPVPEAPWQIALDIPQYIVVLFGLIGGVYFWWKGALDRNARDFLVLILATVLINALVVSFSAASARYEARVIWLVPMVGLLFAFRARL